LQFFSPFIQGVDTVGQALIKEALSCEIELADLKMGFDNTDVLVFFGVFEGALYRSLSSQLKKREECYLVFIEDKEEAFLRAKQLPLAKDPKVRLFYLKEGDEEIFKQIAWEFVFLRFAYGIQDPCDEERAREVFLMVEHYHRGVDLLASDCEDRGFRVLSNVVSNLSLLPKSRFGPSAGGKCAGMPAIVCGAGPSLNDALPLLATLQDQALIIAGGSAVLALNAYGITPHIMAGIDPGPPHGRFLQQGSFETPFFYQGRFDCELLQRVQGPLLWIPDGGSYPLEAWLAAECGVLAERWDAGWTVSNFCTTLVAHLGCTTVVFVGMDLSCGVDGVYASALSGEEHRDALIELEKGQLYSKNDWQMSAEWMGAFAVKHPEIEWINASGAGLELPGIQRKDLSEVVGDCFLKRWDVHAVVHSLVTQAEAILVSSEKIRLVRKKLLNSFEKSLSLCEAMLKMWEKYHPHSPLGKGDYVLLDHELEQEVCERYFLEPLWNVWKRPILRTSFHPLGQHIHRLLFFKNALEMHLPYLRTFL
jgi:hypothetical protein